MGKLEAGVIFKNEKNELFLLADSSNQRWFVNLVTGHTKWAFKGGEGSIADAEKKGYKFVMLSKDLTTHTETHIKAIIKDEKIPDEYNPLLGFAKLLQELKV